MNKILILTFTILSMLLLMISADDVSPSKNQVSMPIQNIELYATGFRAKDIGIGAEGDQYTIGKDGNLYQFNERSRTFEVVMGDREIPRLGRVDVNEDGSPYVITEHGGQMFYLDCSNNWITLPGCATDIGIGRGGQIWKSGCDERLGGFGVWKLFCTKTSCSGNCNRECNRFRNSRYSSKAKEEKQHCKWERVEGSGVRLDIDPQGYPWVVANNNKIYHYDGVNWKKVNGFYARDITVSNEGIVLASSIDSNYVGRLVCADLGTWMILNAKSISISAGPYSLFTTVSEDHHLLTNVYNL